MAGRINFERGVDFGRSRRVDESRLGCRRLQVTSRRWAPASGEVVLSMNFGSWIAGLDLQVTSVTSPVTLLCYESRHYSTCNM